MLRYLLAPLALLALQACNDQAGDYDTPDRTFYLNPELSIAEQNAIWSGIQAWQDFQPIHFHIVNEYRDKGDLQPGDVSVSHVATATFVVGGPGETVEGETQALYSGGYIMHFTDASESEDQADLNRIAKHEIGHALNLEHINDANKQNIMCFALNAPCSSADFTAVDLKQYNSIWH